jgi:hypothetical protein
MGGFPASKEDEGGDVRVDGGGDRVRRGLLDFLNKELAKVVKKR